MLVQFTYVACRSICDRNQNGIKQSVFLLGADQWIKTNSEWIKSTDQHIVSFPDPNNPSADRVRYSVFPSSCNIRLQGREPCHPIKLQKVLNSALWLAHTVDAVATGSCKNLEKRCTGDSRWGCLCLGTRLINT